MILNLVEKSNWLKWKESNYKNKGSKEEFINYVGSLYYAKYRCEEIYNRLQDIENKGFSF